MRELIKIPNVDLERYPEEIDQTHSLEGPKSQLTIGDLHGNTLKLMYFLVRQNVLKVTPLDYETIIKIYNSDPIKEHDLESFKSILERAEVQNRPMIRLIGDELADRGNNDYFTLKVLEKLAVEEVPFEILLSNHGLEFLHAYEHFYHQGSINGFFCSSMGFGQAKSMNKLHALLEESLVTEDEVKYLVDNYYKPNLKVIAYTLDQQSIMLCTHAFVGLETLKALAKHFKVQYAENSKLQLAKTIDAINAKFRLLAKGNSVHASADLTFDTKDPRHIKTLNPLLTVTWYAGYVEDVPKVSSLQSTIREFGDDLKLPNSQYGYRLYYIHGHDKKGWVPTAIKDYVINLDNALGIVTNQGEYTVIYSQGICSLKREHQLFIEKLDAYIKEHEKIKVKLQEKLATLKEKMNSEDFWESGEYKKTLQVQLDITQIKINVASKMKMLLITNNQDKSIGFDKEEFEALRNGSLGSIISEFEMVLPDALVKLEEYIKLEKGPDRKTCTVS